MKMRNMCARLQTAFLLAALLAPVPGGSAEMPGSGALGALGDLGELEVLSDQTMDEQRGGFAVAGMQVNLGAEIRTYIDDQLVVQTNVSWQDGALGTVRDVAQTLTRIDTSGLNDGMLRTGSITMPVGNAEVLQTNDGQTALVFRPDAPLQSAIINTASNVVLRQEIDSTIDLAGYERFRSDIVVDRTATELRSMLDFAMIAGMSR